MSKDFPMATYKTQQVTPINSFILNQPVEKDRDRNQRESTAMGQKLVGHTVPTETPEELRNSVLDMNQDDSVLILIKHCRDMKQQESRLRLVTLLLLLSCMALVIFATLMQHKPSSQRVSLKDFFGGGVLCLP